MDDIQYRVAMAGAEVTDEDAVLLCEALDGLYVAACEIHDMDVVTDAGTIRCVIVVAEDIDLRKLSNGHLCHVWQQIVRDALRILADETRLVGTDRVKVTKQDDVPLWICGMNICENLLLHPLGPAIRIRAGTLRAVLCNWNFRRIAIDSS